MSQSKGESGDGSTPAQTPASSEPPNNLEELDLNDLIVETKNLTYTYDSKKGNVLNKINLTFPRGAIYGFLGPSGCGKTTVIKLLIGHLNPVSGSIRINGKPIKDVSNKIPGAGVGYMPQEFSIYMELTIMEALLYFARIYGLPPDYKKKRINFLIKFLDLPDPHRITSVLSGGQKRRLSLAIALIHNPKLLILDEPTVGVDPMLRERIWQHLVYLSAEEKTSIMITTHYIDECHRAHVIALLRNGNLLVENTPTVLLKHFQTTNLEDVFLEVCRGEEKQSRPNLPPNLAQVKELNAKNIKPGKPAVKKIDSSESFRSSFCGRYLAVLQKNAKKLMRQKLYIFALLISPLISTILICTTFGHAPRGLNVAVYNPEKEENVKDNFSEQLLEKIDKNTIPLEYHKSNDSALNSVRDGKTYGALIVHENFTTALILRLTAKNFAASDEVIRWSTIQFFADTTDFMIFQSMYKTLMDAQMDFANGLLKKFNTSQTNPKAMQMIVVLKDPPIYGSTNPKFRDFAGPGMLILVVYLFSMAVTTLDIVGERKEGTLERTLVAGVNMLEIILALITLQFALLLIQTISILFIVLYLFDQTNEGSVLLIVLLMLAQGLSGMGCGLFMSSISYDELMAMELCVGIFLPFLIISGVIWPLEGMHYILRTISLFTPQTLPILSVRNIMLKGWGIQNAMVLSGFFAAFGFLIFFVILATIANSLVKF